MYLNKPKFTINDGAFFRSKFSYPNGFFMSCVDPSTFTAGYNIASSRLFVENDILVVGLAENNTINFSVYVYSIGH